MLHLLQNARREPSNRTIALSLADSIEFVPVQSIVRCESDSNYTTFFLKTGEQLIVSRTLKEFDELLASHGQQLHYFLSQNRRTTHRVAHPERI